MVGGLHLNVSQYSEIQKKVFTKATLPPSVIPVHWVQELFSRTVLARQMFTEMGQEDMVMLRVGQSTASREVQNTETDVV